MNQAQQEVAVIEQGGAVAAVTPMQLVQMAVQQGADVDKLEKLLQLQLRWEAEQARKAFVAAMAKFKDNPPRIVKNKDVDFTSAKGRTHYRHATLDNVSGIIGDALSKVGISHRWEVEQLEGGAIRVTCVLTHEQGHSERVALQAGRDDSGNKNSIQGVGSTVTYLQRYTLLSATGMAVSESDDDAQGGREGMAETVKVDFLAAVDALSDMESWNELWQKITAATTAAGDIAAHEELRGAMAARRKILSAKVPK